MRPLYLPSKLDLLTVAVFTLNAPLALAQPVSLAVAEPVGAETNSAKPVTPDPVAVDAHVAKPVVAASTPLSNDQGTAQPKGPVYKDAARSPAERVADIMARLTLDEKLVLISGQGFESQGIARLGIPDLRMADGPNGVRWGKTGTAYPVAIAAAATWDPDLMKTLGRALALDVKAKERDVLLAPCVNISRVPQNGRNFECFGEDPYLAAQIAVPYIRGVQEEGVIATVKHFACNNQEHRRRDIDVRVDERTLREIYFPAFKAAVQEAGVWTVMAAYNKVNGWWATESDFLLNTILKDEWGFRGFVMSDWDAVQHTVAPVKAGLDLEMPHGWYTKEDYIKPQMASGKITEAMIDDKVRRILWVTFASGSYDRANQPKSRASAAKSPGHGFSKSTALKIAQESMVLLKNRNRVLPIGDRVKSIAVIGPGARYPRISGGGSGLVQPEFAEAPLRAIEREANRRNIKVTYTPGFAMDGDAEIIPATAYRQENGKPGLTATYFNNRDVAGTPVYTETVSLIDQHWSNKSPNTKVNGDNFSGKFTGFLLPPEAGAYRFVGVANDGFRLYLDDKEVLANWQGSIVNDGSIVVNLEKRPYKIRVDFFEGVGTAHIKLKWARAEVSDAAALANAKSADMVLFFAGGSTVLEREGQDHPLTLPKVQEDLIRRVARVNEKTVVVLNYGSPLLMESWVQKVPGILNAWYPGEAGAKATADILFGKTNPSGKLPFTFPKRWEDAPAFETYPEVENGAPYREGVFVGYRHYDSRKRPVRFPFGHGLSYASFDYKNLRVTRREPAATSSPSTSSPSAPLTPSADSLVTDSPVTDLVPRPTPPTRADNALVSYDVSLQVTNRSKTAGAEVVQRLNLCRGRVAARPTSQTKDGQTDAPGPHRRDSLRREG